MSEYANKTAQYLDKAIIEQIDDSLDNVRKLLRDNQVVLEKVADTRKLQSIIEEAVAEIRSWANGVRSAT